jgi:hypothetical protein
MRHLTLTLRQAFWMVCACVFLLPHVAAAEPSLTIDLDGDGRRDQVMLDGREPSFLHVWLSASGKTQTIRSRVPLLQFVVADLDGDHRPELIARDSDSQLHVWTRKRKGFHSFRPRHPISPPLVRRDLRNIEDQDGEPLGEITSTPDAPFALALCASPRAPGLEASAARAPHPARAGRSLTAVDPFAPRPPPAHVAL